MDPESNDIELIEKYLQGQMDPAEKVAFEDRLDEDHELARKLRLRKVFPSLFNADGEDLITQELNTPPEVQHTGHEARWSGGRIFLWIMIMVAVLGISGYLVYFIMNRSGNQEKQPSLTETAVPDTISSPSTQKVAEQVSPEPAEEPAPASDDILEGPVVLEIPDDSAIFTRKEEILFRWRLETDTFTNFFIYSLADEKMMWWKGIRPGIREYTVSATNLRPGRYYWYVGTRDIRRIFEVSQ